MDTFETTVTVGDMYEIVGCRREACTFEYTTYPKWKLEESIRKTQIYLVNLRSFRSLCLPSAKRLKYEKAYGSHSAIPDSEESEDEASLESFLSFTREVGMKKEAEDPDVEANWERCVHFF